MSDRSSIQRIDISQEREREKIALIDREWIILYQELSSRVKLLLAIIDIGKTKSREFSLSIVGKTTYIRLRLNT